MGTTDSYDVYQFDITDDNIGPIAFNRLSASLTSIMSTSIRIKRVADTSARATYLAQFGTPSVANPCVVFRADATAGLQLEFNDNTGWKPWLSWKTPVVQTFTTSGTYTPTTGMRYAVVEVQAGGGGGGGVTGGTAATHSGAAGSGQGGVYSRSILTSTTIGASQAVIVGVGGPGAAAGNNAGTAGGDSSFGVLVSAGGGAPGNGSLGTATDIALFRSNSSTTSAGVGNIVIPGTIPPARLRATNASNLVSPPGGNSILGAGDQGANTSGGASVAGGNGTGYGGGGSGAVSLGSAGGTARAGGNGSPGVVIVTEYF